jgi:hypothetical protein
MATESPLFQSAMELYGHAVEHFAGGSEMDRKLVILHLANAAELLLKDLLLDQDVSIYKNPKETITIHAAVSLLGDCTVKLPNFNKMELLIDERNALQHRYGSPNELTTVFYMEAATDFFASMLAEHYDLQLDELLPQFVEPMHLAAFQQRRPADETELEELKKLAKLHPIGAFLSASRYLESLVQDFFANIEGGEVVRRRPPWAMVSGRMLSRFGVFLPDVLEDRLEQLRRKRNLIMHGREDASEGDVAEAIETIEALEEALAQVDEAEVEEALRLDREATGRHQGLERPATRRVASGSESSLDQGPSAEHGPS